VKRTLFAIPIALLLLALRLTACAEETEPDTFTSGDYTYILPENGAAEITGYWGKAENLTIPDQLDGHPVTAIGDSAFSSCSSLTSVSIPDSVTAIGDSAFSDCSRLTSVSIPDSVTAIGNRAFSYCSSLTSVSIPDSVTAIGNWAFYECSSLTSVSIPDSVTAIGDRAFSNCSNLTLSVGRDSYAFQYCKENGLNYTYNDSLDWLNN